MRLQKYMAEAGVASRRASEEIIRNGRVEVNGTVVTQMGFEVDPHTDVIRVDHQHIQAQKDRVYYLFYKPRGVATTMADDRGRRSVADYFSQVDRRLFPVGRLDMDSEGMLLVTDDGDFAQRASHPKYGAQKVYQCTIDGAYTEEKSRALLSGLDIGEKVAARAERISFQNRKDGKAVLRITLAQGMNRQIRRMLEEQGYQTVRLKRVQMGGLIMGDMKPGSFRRISKEEAFWALESS